MLRVEQYFGHKDEDGRRFAWYLSNGQVLRLSLSRGYGGGIAELTTRGGDGDDALGVTFALPKTFFVHLELERVFRQSGPERQYGASLYGDHFVYSWGYSEDYGGRGRGFRRSFFLLDRLLGRAKYATEALRTSRVLVPLPEGTYPTTLTFDRSSWKRPRWPWAKVGYYVNIEPDTPYPVEGKGENGWDIGEDAIYSISRAAKTESEAVGQAVETVLRRRQKHGVPDSVRWSGGFLLSREAAQ